MKALPMFDRFMLQWARGFTAICAGFLVFPVLLMIFCAFAIVVLQWMGHRPGIHGSPVVIGAAMEGLQSLNNPKHLLYIVYSLLFFCSVRMLPSTIARICLGLTAAIPAVSLGLAIVVVPLGCVIAPRNSTSLFMFGLMVLLILPIFLGFFSMTWISLRPPRSHPLNSI